MAPSPHPAQRFVSDELTHFVGSSLPTAEQRYGLLLQILKSGLLKMPEKSDRTVERTETEPQTTTKRTISIQHDAPLSSNRKYVGSIVCFADIPLEDLPFHIRKYSEFGLSFSKTFLIGRGANPVFYVARQSSTEVRNPLANDPIHHQRLTQSAVTNRNKGHWENFTRAELFDVAEKIQQRVLPTHPRWDKEQGRVIDKQLTEDEQLLRDFLTWYLFGFMKFFDPELPEHDVDNYYMEREWRVIGHVDFTNEDVERILIPREFYRRLRADLSGYCGQVTFTTPTAPATR
jgi:hypothetical protein